MVSARTKPCSTMSFRDSLAFVRGAAPNSVFYTGASPEELRALYSLGYQGVRPDSATPETKKAYRDMMAEMPGLYDIFPWAKGIGKGLANCSDLACSHLIKGWGGLYAQVQGDCTVHSTEHAAEVDYCNDCVWGETKFMGPLAFENIYRSRGFNGDGWSCEAPAVYTGPNGRGGFLYRKLYEGPGGEKVDLTKYNSSWQSAGRSGVPAWLEEISRQNKAKWIIPIGNMEEYRDAIALGFGISFCSGQAWTDSTDEWGVATARGSWSHAMAHTWCLDTAWVIAKYKEMLGKIQNSWGMWNNINGHPEGCPELSPGSFLTRVASVSRLLDGDQYAICGVWGFERTGWEVFVASDMVKHLRSSTVQDYYKTRQERLAEGTRAALEKSGSLFQAL